MLVIEDPVGVAGCWLLVALSFFRVTGFLYVLEAELPCLLGNGFPKPLTRVFNLKCVFESLGCQATSDYLLTPLKVCTVGKQGVY